jgi:uncharacterized membrane protein YfhO
MGFTYDSALSRTQFESMNKGNRHLTMLKAIVLEDEDYDKYISLLSDAKTNEWWYTEEDYYLDCTERAANSCYYFEIDNLGFSAKINSDKANLLFFSVPYDEGWSATVNGEPVEIVKANVGFMAVEIQSGENDVRFEYTTPGLSLGIKISLIALAVLVVYVAVVVILDRRKNSLKMAVVETSDEQKGI